MAFCIWFLFLIVSLSIVKPSSMQFYQTGCFFDYRAEDCTYNITCIDSTLLSSPYDFTNSEYYCPNSISMNGYNYDPARVSFRRISTNDNDEDAYNIIWQNDNYPISDLIIEMDISNNQFKLQPVLSSMANLKFLNISHNELTSAILSNTIEFNNLIEIDFSYNRIMDIKVDSGEYIYNNLRKLDLSHNALYKIPEAIFNSFAELDELNLSYNRITALNVLDFEGIRKLRSLLLDYNELADINSSLLRFRDLQKLALKGNKLTKLLKIDFQNLINLQSLDVSCNKIISVERNTFDNMTSLSYLNLSKNVIDFIDKESFNYLHSLKSIDLSSNNLKYLPIEMFVGRNISFFSVDDNVLEGELKVGTFYGLNEIMLLNITNQYLTSIGDNAFSGLSNIKILLLFNNKINFLSKDSFKSLQSLTELNLSNNYIVSIDFNKEDLINLRLLYLNDNIISNLKQEDFSSLKNLQFCDLTSNNITTIKDNSFKDLVMLLNLKISHNPLINIETNTFGGLTQLPNIDISFSKISLLKNNTFQNFNLLKYINISYSDIAEIQFNSFVGIKHVVTIDLSHNKLTNFAINTTDLNNLQSLLLNNNHLTEISYYSLKKLINLFKVSFSYNNIKKVHDEAFVDQKSLQELDLSYNPLLVYNVPDYALYNLRSLNVSGDISNVSFSRMNGSHLLDLVYTHAKIQNITSLSLKNFRNITNLVLNNNEIANINKDAFTKVDLLQYLDLSYNNIKYIQPGAFKNNRDLKSLNVSHNFVTALNYGTLRGLIALSLLDLSFNYIDSLEKEKLNEIPNLEILIVDNNYIHDINYSEFLTTSLSILSIGDNPLPCKQIYELKEKAYVNVTALRRDEHHENVDGITCNKHYSQPKVKQPTNKDDYSDKIVDVLKNLLNNASKNCEKCNNNSNSKNDAVIENREFVSNITQLIQKSSTDVLNEFSQLNDAAKSTNSLLERLLKVIVTMNSAIRRPVTELKENGTSSNITLYLNKIKQDLEDNIIVQRESILAELDNKINSAMAKKRPIQEKVIGEERKTVDHKVNFTEICVALILSILVGLLIFQSYKWYKANCTWMRLPTAFNSGHITDMENSNL